MELLNSCSEGLEMLEALNVADTSQIGEKKKKMKKWNQIKKILNLYPFKIIQNLKNLLKNATCIENAFSGLAMQE